VTVMARTAMAVALASGLLAAARAHAACVLDPVCVDGCKQANCGAADPAGTPADAFGTCIAGCTDQPNCAGLVTCMRPCYEQRAAAQAQCKADRQACIRREKCRKCTKPAAAAVPRSAVPQAASEACLRKCRKQRATCREANAGRVRGRRLCLSECRDRCGAFPEFPAALAACHDNCVEKNGLAACGDNFDSCKSACEIE